MPIYNESEILKQSMTKILDYFKNRDGYEIIISDDGSTDGLENKIKENYKDNQNIIYIREVKNKGKGSAVRKGVLKSRGEYVLFTDTDLSTPIYELDRFLEYLSEGSDIVIASRRLNNKDVLRSYPFLRRLISDLFHVLVSAFYLPNISDSQCGFKCFKGDIAREIFKKLKLDGYCFEIEMLLLARRSKHKITELPVSWKYVLKNRNKKFNFIFNSLSIFKELCYLISKL